MTLKVPNQGEVLALKAILNITAPQDLRLKLFKSNTTPGDTDTEATYTVADFTGYANFDFVAGNWVVTGGNPSSADYPAVDFVSSAGGQSQNVYGYYVIQVSSGKLIWAERFSDGPYLIEDNGDTIRVTAKLTGTTA